MRPQITLHMTTSIDGRALVPKWHPADVVAGSLWREAYARLGIHTRIMGRTTGAELAHSRAYPRADESFDREDHIVVPRTDNLRVVIDPGGKLSWSGVDLGDAHPVVVLTDDISDSHLAGLRRDGVSYLFAGSTTADLPTMLDKVGDELGVTQSLLSGGPATCGRFLRAGLIDHLSLLLAPTIDGSDTSPNIFSGGGDISDDAFPFGKIELDKVDTLSSGVLWLRYSLGARGSAV